MDKKLCGLAIAGALFVAGPAAAQLPDVHVEPYVGIFVPLNKVADTNALGFTFDIDQQTGLAVGGRATTFLRGRWGVQADFLYAFSDADVKLGSFGPQERNAYVWALDGRVVYALRPYPTALFLSGGVGVISRGDAAYREITSGETDVTGVLGLGLRLGASQRLALRFDADGYLYSARPTVASRDFDQDLPLNSNFQVDLVFSAGFQLTLSP